MKSTGAVIYKVCYKYCEMKDRESFIREDEEVFEEC